MFRLHAIVWIHKPEVYSRADCPIPNVHSLAIDSRIALEMDSAFRRFTLNQTILVHSQNFKSSGAVQRRDVLRGQFWHSYPRFIDITGRPECLFGRKDTIFPKNFERSKTRRRFQKFLLTLKSLN